MLIVLYLKDLIHDLLNIFCSEMNYKPIVFNSLYQSKPIYHTNVMMSICNNFSIICLDSIEDENQKNRCNYKSKKFKSRNY